MVHMEAARDIHPNLRVHCYSKDRVGAGPGWQARRRATQAQIEADLAAAMPGRPTALQKLLIERIAALTVEVRGMRARGKIGPEVTGLERIIIQGTRSLGLGGALSGYDIQAQNNRRSAARTGGNNDDLRAIAAALDAEEAEG
jgi:hypothetical protein